MEIESYRGIDPKNVLSYLKSNMINQQQLSNDPDRKVIKVGSYVMREIPLALRSFGALSKLHGEGLPIEKPVMVIRRYPPVLVTEFIGGKDYAEIIYEKDEQAHEMKELGRSLYAFNSSGYLLSDPSPRNYIFNGKAVRIDVNYIYKKFSKKHWRRMNEKLLLHSVVQIRDGFLPYIAGYVWDKKSDSSFEQIIEQLLNGYRNENDKSSMLVSNAVELDIDDFKNMLEESRRTDENFRSIYMKKLDQKVKSGRMREVKIFEK